MKSILYIFLLFLLGCKLSTNNESKSKISIQANQTNCTKSIMIDTLKQSLISLNYDDFDTLAIKKIFKTPYIFQITKTFQGDNGFICRFKSEISEVIFSVRGYNREYYLDYANIRDNSIQFNYNITIGMKKEDFYLNLKQPLIQCDSIKITEIGSMSLFVFDKNKLKEILLTTTM